MNEIQSLQKISKVTLNELCNWLEDAYFEISQNDPSVGIFANDDLADAFKVLQSFIENVIINADIKCPDCGGFVVHSINSFKCDKCCKLWPKGYGHEYK